MEKKQKQIENFIQSLENEGLNEKEQAFVLTGQLGGSTGEFVAYLPCVTGNNSACSNWGSGCASTNSGCRNYVKQCASGSNTNCTNNVI